MRKKIMALLFIVSIVFSACAGAQTETVAAETQARTEASAYDYAEKNEAPTATESGTTANAPGEKMIERYTLYQQTETYDDSFSKIQKAVEANGAFFDGVEVNNGTLLSDHQGRDAWFLIRVEAEKTEALLSQLRTAAHVSNESLSKENVTAQYNDLENRRTVLQAKEKRLLALIEKAETMEDLITVETSLGETIAEIEDITAQLNDLDRKVQYRFIEVYLTEVRSIEASQSVDASFTTRIETAFSSTFASFRHNVEDLIIGLIYGLPYLIFLAVVIVLIVLFVRKLTGVKRKQPITKETEEPTHKDDAR